LIPSAKSLAPSKFGNPARSAPFFHDVNGRLHCESVALERVAGRVGTPAYVYSSASIAGAYRSLDALFAGRGGLPHTICYAMKANSNLSILKLLSRLGSGFDIVSGGELQRVQAAGIATSRVVFSGVGKSREEIRDALRARIMLFNVESEAELETLSAEAARLRLPAPAGIRVNPEVDSGSHPHIATGNRGHKFGIGWTEARRLYLRFRQSRWIRWQGISTHIGSQILDIKPFRRAVTRLAGFARALQRAGIPLRYFDFGGGIGVRYSVESPLALRTYAGVVRAAVKPLGLRLLLEPGRVIVGPAGVLLTRVLATKENYGKRFIVTDAAMNDFMRPALYGALHPITPEAGAKRRSRSGSARADIVGPVCETGDCFVQDWPIGPVEAGDLLVLWGAGAYGSVQASNYNSRTRPPEVLVSGSSFRVVRRRERFADLIRGE